MSTVTWSADLRSAASVLGRCSNGMWRQWLLKNQRLTELSRTCEFPRHRRTEDNAMLTFNEGKVCDAIIRCLEAREGAQRTELHSPEEDRLGEPVELVCQSAQNCAIATIYAKIYQFATHKHMP